MLAAGCAFSDDNEKRGDAKPVSVTITKIDIKNGEVTVKVADDKGGEPKERTLKIGSDVKLFDETGRGVKLDFFESGHNAVVVETGGALRELRRIVNRGQARRLSDSVRVMIELTDCEEGCTTDLQKIYDMLRKLDTKGDGKIDPQALKVEADNILKERVKQTFERLDPKNTGKITKENARGMIREHFDRLDANKDGAIDFDELLKAATERRDQQASTEKENK